MDLFLTNSGIESTHWALFSNQCRISEAAEDIGYLAHDSVLWVVTSVTHWQDIVQEASSNGQIAVVLYTVPTVEEMAQAVSAGARGYCTAIADVSSLHAVRTTVTAGGLWIPANFLGQVTKTLAGVMQASATANTYEERLASCNLTQRERSVVLAVLDGCSNKEIADKLFVSERTVKEHLGNIFKKLKVKDRLQLVLWVMKN